LLIPGRFILFIRFAREGESGASLDEVHAAGIGRTPLLTVTLKNVPPPPHRSDHGKADEGDGSGTSRSDA
jgi:hypothetical protein